MSCCVYVSQLVLSLSVVVIINVLWEGSAFIRQASMVRHSGARYSSLSMEDLILSDASAGEDAADTGEEYNMCESLCDAGALNTTVESPLICYSFWWFYYEEVCAEMLF